MSVVAVAPVNVGILFRCQKGPKCFYLFTIMDQAARHGILRRDTGSIAEIALSLGTARTV